MRAGPVVAGGQRTRQDNAHAFARRLLKLKQTRQRVNHYCVEGWTAVADWWGVRVSELARLAGVRPDAKYVDFQSFDDGYHESWDIDSALHPQTLIAYAMDGKLLTPAHGAPARLHSPSSSAKEHEVPDACGLHAPAHRRLLERSGLRVVRGNLAARSAGRVLERELERLGAPLGIQTSTPSRRAERDRPASIPPRSDSRRRYPVDRNADHLIEVALGDRSARECCSGSRFYCQVGASSPSTR